MRVNAIEDYQDKPCQLQNIDSLSRDEKFSVHPTMATMQIDVGRKNKIRPGDILGALTGDAGLSGSQIGKIDIFDIASYIAIDRKALRQVLDYFANGKIKGKLVRARMIS